jgi:hypothetical protein
MLIKNVTFVLRLCVYKFACYVYWAKLVLPDMEFLCSAAMGQNHK